MMNVYFRFITTTESLSYTRISFFLNVTRIIRRQLEIYSPLLLDEVSEGISDDIMPLNN
jgi:hypothetical protein